MRLVESSNKASLSYKGCPKLRELSASKFPSNIYHKSLQTFQNFSLFTVFKTSQITMGVSNFFNFRSCKTSKCSDTKLHRGASESEVAGSRRNHADMYCGYCQNYWNTDNDWDYCPHESKSASIIIPCNSLLHVELIQEIWVCDGGFTTLLDDLFSELNFVSLFSSFALDLV